MPSVVPIVPAPVTASSRTLNWEMALDWEMALPFLSGSTSSPLRWWGYTVLAGSFKDGSGQSVPLPGVVLTNQAQCKLLPEVFDNSMAIADGDGAVMLDQREGIDYAAFKEKPEDVLITLLGLGSQPVVSPELVTSVNPPHELVICDYIRGACHGLNLPVFLLAPHRCGTSGLAVGRHYRHQLLVLPDVGHKISLLAED